MERNVFYMAYFLICFNIGGLATTNILRLTCGNELPVLASKCHCDKCGMTIPPVLQLPIVSYIVCKGKCRSCKTKIPIFALVLEIVVLLGMFITQFCLDFTFFGVTLSFIFYEIIRLFVVVKKGKRENNFIQQYVVAVLAMVPYYIMTVFVSLLYEIVCGR